ncbi:MULTISPECIES: hypothetical protein [Streptomyces]|uniref:hypothetical protein n=1 Tax=Streptomyces lycopersici TaxID=2974589 RepID=UPI0021D054F7|nr:hypothetical protein [Streptomyces sp. NEAU-383]
MNGFLSTLGGKLADRWLSLLALPGLLLLCTVWIAAALGHRHWNDTGLLTDDINRLAHEPAMRSPGVTVLVLVGILIGSAATGILAQSLGRAIEQLWLSNWAIPPAHWLTAWRRRRWHEARARYKSALEDKYHSRFQQTSQASDAAVRRPPTPEISRLNDARNRISLAEPCRPTWIGDRVAAAQSRVRDAYDLDLGFAWPRLWLILPDVARAELHTAAESLAAAARLAAWGLIYLTIGFWWWPAALIGAATVIVGWRRGRGSADVFAHLIEASVDVHGPDLARAFGIDAPPRLTPEIGLEITRTVRKNV